MSHPKATLDAYTGPRPDVAELIPRSAQRILDIGCAEGALGAGLRQRGAEVWGVEYDEGFARVASTRLDHVEVGDAAVALARIPDSPGFDAIVCADVLEHLSNPLAVLRAAKRLLTVDGRMVVSLPNVRFYTTFTELGLRGRWPRRDRGVHDRTHLSWFTDSDARSLFAEGGFVVDHATTNYRLSDNPSRRVNRLAHLVALGPVRPFLAYQHLYRLSPCDP